MFAYFGCGGRAVSYLVNCGSVKEAERIVESASEAMIAPRFKSIDSTTAPSVGSLALKTKVSPPLPDA
jgi:hypothetical protein